MIWARELDRKLTLIKYRGTCATQEQWVVRGLFYREEWLKGTQIQGFFSRLASARRRRNNAQQSLVIENEDVEDTHEHEEHNAMVEEVINEMELKASYYF